MTVGKPKTGRRANQDECDIARDWVELYRTAQSQPGGSLCLNPADEPDEQTWIDGNDPDHLLSMLERFAKHGTFKHVGKESISIHWFLMRLEFKKMRANRVSYANAVALLAEKHSCSERTIERRLRTDKP